MLPALGPLRRRIALAIWPEGAPWPADIRHPIKEGY